MIIHSKTGPYRSYINQKTPTHAVFTMYNLLCLLVLAAAASAAPGSRILGGQNATRGEFYYQVSLQFCITTNCQHTCGGAIITPSWVVTAAHCFTDAPVLGRYQVLAGVVDLNGNGTEREMRNVRLVFMHPRYRGGQGPHDLAVFKVDTPFTFNEAVDAIELPDPGHEFAYDALVSGWGTTGASYPNTLQYALVPVIPIRACREALDALLGSTPHPLDDDANICTGPLTGGVSTCTGDAGGPLYQPVRHFLLGVVTWGITPCGLVGAPSVYTKISYYVPWLEEVIDEPL